MEFCVSKPEVITEERDGKTFEPMEDLVVDIPEEYQGVVFEKLSRRKARVQEIQNLRTGLMRIFFAVPTRGLIGYRGEFLTDTRGLGIMSSRFSGYAPWVGEITPRNRGALVSLDTGEATSYQLENLQERGVLFISPMDKIYSGMIVGENARPGDMPCNPTKRKQATNHRSSTKDFTIKLDVPRKMTLEKALEWISEDELVEVTPKSIRLRKSILDDNDPRERLDASAHKRQARSSTGSGISFLRQRHLEEKRSTSRFAGNRDAPHPIRRARSSMFTSPHVRVPRPVRAPSPHQNRCDRPSTFTRRASPPIPAIIFTFFAFPPRTAFITLYRTILKTAVRPGATEHPHVLQSKNERRTLRRIVPEKQGGSEGCAGLFQTRGVELEEKRTRFEKSVRQVPPSSRPAPPRGQNPLSRYFGEVDHQARCWRTS